MLNKCANGFFENLLATKFHADRPQFLSVDLVARAGLAAGDHTVARGQSAGDFGDVKFRDVAVVAIECLASDSICGQ